MKEKILKLVKISATLYVMFTLVFSLIVSQNNHHLEVCHQEHCFTCTMIHFAQIIVSLSIVFVVLSMIGFLVYFFLSRLHKEVFVFVQSSLVSQKVQFNE